MSESDNDVIDVRGKSGEDANDPETDRVTRDMCREDIKRLKDAQERGEELTAKELAKMVVDSNRRVDVIQSSREGALDTHRLKLMSTARNKIINDLEDDYKFDADLFAASMLEYIGVDDFVDYTAEAETNENWICFGNYVSYIFRPPPNFAHVNGAYDHKILQKDPVEKVKKAKQIREKVDKANATNIAKVNPKKSGEKDETSTQVDMSLHKLKDYCRKNNNRMCYFKFVVDPKSFGRTVENMFHVSFLVRDGLVGIDYDENELPYLLIVKKNRTAELHTQSLANAGDIEGAVESQENDLSAQSNTQCVISICMNEWKEIVEVFKIKEAFITAEDYEKSVAARENREIPGDK